MEEGTKDRGRRGFTQEEDRDTSWVIVKGHTMATTAQNNSTDSVHAWPHGVRNRHSAFLSCFMMSHLVFVTSSSVGFTQKLRLVKLGISAISFLRNVRAPSFTFIPAIQVCDGWFNNGREQRLSRIHNASLKIAKFFQLLLAQNSPQLKMSAECRSASSANQGTPRATGSMTSKSAPFLRHATNY